MAIDASYPASPLAFNFPSHFTIPQLGNFIELHFPLTVNPHFVAAAVEAEKWFIKVPIYTTERGRVKFLKKARFEALCKLTFPHADADRLTTCLMYYLWACTVDDLADEPGEGAGGGSFAHMVKLSKDVLCSWEPLEPSPDPYVKMLQDVLVRTRASGSKGMHNRLAQSFDDWCTSQVAQSKQRTHETLPTLPKFLVERRKAFGIGLFCAIIEFSWDIHLPDFVLQDPDVVEITEVLFDLTIWTNDICSFNKEQAQRDYQNMLPVLMHESHIDLQAAIDKATEMLQHRLQTYYRLKTELVNKFAFAHGSGEYPQLNLKTELLRYLEGCETMTAGTIKWYYQSSRYFRDLEAMEGSEVQVTLFERDSIGR